MDRTFDPQWHKVAEIVVDETKPEGTIVEELKKGFLWRNQILRKAEVVVVRMTARSRSLAKEGNAHHRSSPACFGAHGPWRELSSGNKSVDREWLDELSCSLAALFDKRVGVRPAAATPGRRAV